MSAGSLGGNIRTIWITIRAVNYTSRVFQDINTVMKTTIKTEKDMADMTKNLAKTSTDFIAAGTMMIALSAMIGMQMWNLAASSKEGARDFAQLTANIDATKSALADSMYEILKATGVLNMLNSILSFIRDNKWAQYLILGLGIVLITVVALVGALFLFNGLVLQAGLFSTNWAIMTGFLTSSLSTLTAGLIPLNIEMWQLAGAMAAVGGAFLLFMMLKDITGPIAAAIIAITALTIALWILFAAEAASSLGIALIAGGAAVIAATAIASQTMGKFQGGTRSIPYTGPIIAHKGEVIYNPSTNRPLQVGNDLAKEGGGEENVYNMPITIENVHTKAEMDDVDEQMRKALRRNMRGRK